jgi:hypothetical protein
MACRPSRSTRHIQPADFLKQALQIKGMRTYPDYYFTMMMDKYGSGPLYKRYSWLPEPLFQNKCVAALAELEKLVSAAGDKLVVTDFSRRSSWPIRSAVKSSGRLKRASTPP